MVGLLGVTLLPAQVGASGTADVAVVLALIDDAGEPQRLRATVTNQGPQGSAHPILEVDAGEGAEVTGHTGDPQPGSLADGVACASRPEGFSCQWEELAAGAQVAVDIELSVAAATTVTARLDAAGTPDHNPEGNNLATLALSPATTDLAVAVVVTLADRTATLAVTVANVAGRRDSAGLGIVPAPAVTPAGCNADGARASCPVSALAAGEAVSFEAVIERPSPGAEPAVVSVAAVPSTYEDPRPADNTAEVDIPPREAVAGEVVRLAGSERIATAVAISRAGFADGSAGAVVLARADLFADALAGAPLAVAVGGPLLLTPGAALADATRAELARVLPAGGTVYLLGGTAALGEAVAQDVTEAGFTPVRVAGANRYATSAAVDAALGHPVALAYADGDTFADALIAGAAMAARGGALLLTSGDRLPPETAARAGDAIYAVGAAAAQAVPDALHALVGTTPAETSVLVASELFAGPSAVGIATADAFPDALAGGPHAAALGAPVLLTPTAALDSSVDQYLRGTAPITRAWLFGGTAALSTTVEEAVHDALLR